MNWNNETREPIPGLEPAVGSRIWNLNHQIYPNDLYACSTTSPRSQFVFESCSKGLMYYDPSTQYLSTAFM